MLHHHLAFLPFLSFPPLISQIIASCNNSPQSTTPNHEAHPDYQHGRSPPPPPLRSPLPLCRRSCRNCRAHIPPAVQAAVHRRLLRSLHRRRVLHPVVSGELSVREFRKGTVCGGVWGGRARPAGLLDMKCGGFFFLFLCWGNAMERRQGGRGKKNVYHIRRRGEGREGRKYLDHV